MADTKANPAPNPNNYKPKIKLAGKTQVIIVGNKNVRCNTPNVELLHRTVGG